MAWEPPSIPLTFPNLGNALLAGEQARYYGQKTSTEAAEEKRKSEAQPYIDAAMKGDNGAMGKLAYGDPKAAVAISTALSRMDANKRADIKAKADYTANGANAILQAAPADRAAVYAQVRQQGIANGYDMSSLPEVYSPQLDSVLRTHRAMAIDLNKQLDRDLRLQIHNTPGGGGGPTQIDLPGPGGPVPAPAPAPVAPGRPSASAVPSDVVKNTTVAAAPPTAAPAAPFGDDGGEVALSAPPDLKDGPKQPKRNGAFFEDEPSQFGYVQRGVKDKYGNVTPMTVEGGYFVYRNPKTNEHVLYKPVAPKPTERPLPPEGYTWSPDGGQTFIPGGPADPTVIERNAGVRRASVEKAIPQTITKGMQENISALKQLDRAEALLNQNEGSVGGVGSTLAATIPGVGNLQNRNLMGFGDPNGAQLRAVIADIGSLIIHDRSGAAVSASEFPRLRPFIPSISDDAPTIRKKLANFRAVYEETLRDAASYYGPETGYKAYGPAVDYLNGGGRGEPGKPSTAPERPPLSSFQK